MKIVIIDYESGNLHSVSSAFRKALQEVDISGGDVLVSDRPEDLVGATHIVLPGVGAYEDCISGLHKIPKMVDGLEKRVIGDKIPFLGICVGMQMLFEYSHEHGKHKGLGWLEGEVIPLDRKKVEAEKLRIPHMGWNELEICASSSNRNIQKLLHDVENGDHCYFVHSYYAECKNPSDILAYVNYGGKITAAVGKNNILGTQFHPEKSGHIGRRIIVNFLRNY